MNEDTSPPRVTKVGLSRTSIHLGTDDQIVVARVTVQDDVGIHKVSFHLSDGRVTLPLEGLPWGATRSSGTARDGIYRLRIRVPAHVEPGSYELWVRIRPRVGPDSETSYLTLPVEADQRDVAGPVLEQVIKPGPAVTYHVDQTPTVKLRVTDALAGARRVSVCYRRMPGPSGPHCNLASLVSGSAQDGMWRARLTDLRYLGEGDGEIYIDIGDDAGNSGLWRGPSAVDIPGALLIPGGVGAFTVVP
jgi:hypothetical protein